MPKKYMIRDGFTFRGDDDKTAGGGDVIELEDDVAALHAHKLELVEDPTTRRSPAKQAAPQPDAGAAVQTSAMADQGVDSADQLGDVDAAPADQPADQQ